jgi:predicted secreted hydrolase
MKPAGSLLLLLVLAGPAAPAPGPPPAFQIARPGRTFQFPRDHGAHPAFAIEWWYVTGLLRSRDGARQYGYQLTFFRRGLAPGPWTGSPSWRTDAFLLAHGALTRVTEGRFQFEERFGRLGLPAAAAVGALDLRVGGWTARRDGNRIRVSFSVGGDDLELDLDPATPPVVFGEDGVVRKGADPAAASHYLTFPRLASSGRLRGPGGEEAVRGWSWMDHEFSTTQLAPDQAGWDWAGIRLADGRSLMAYRLRGRDGRQDPWSTLTEVGPDGRIRRATRDFRWTGAGLWRSPGSGAAYPLPVRLEAWGEAWTLEPLVPDQELRTRLGAPITYWEGACRVRDGRGREAGEGYVELTGYAHSMQGRF